MYTCILRGVPQGWKRKIEEEEEWRSVATASLLQQLLHFKKSATRCSIQRASQTLPADSIYNFIIAPSTLC